MAPLNPTAAAWVNRRGARGPPPVRQLPPKEVTKLNERPPRVEKGYDVVNVDPLAREEPPPELVYRRQAWKDGYPWLDRAFKAIGPGERAASEGWRVRIEDELKTTLDFKVRPDGTAVVWCGMSGHDFSHEPTTKELFEGLAEAYRRELERRRRQASDPHLERERRHPEARRAPGVRTLPPPVSESLARILAAVLQARAEDLAAIFLVVTALTLVLSAVAILVS
jgi:hypothetical protein